MSGPPDGSAAVAPNNDAQVKLIKDSYDYPASGFTGDFKGRFLGRVNRRNGEIQLIVNCKWTISSEDPPDWYDRDHTLSTSGKAEFLTFQSEFKSVVQQAWSGVFEIQPDIPADKNFRYAARVIVVNDAEPSDAHLEVIIHSNALSRSSAGEKGGKRIMDLKVGTAGGKPADTRYFDERLMEGDVYNRCTATHEFGHHIGLHHPLQGKLTSAGTQASGLQEYGETAPDKGCIMGWGTTVQERHYQPFLEIAKRYSAEVAPKVTTTWTLVQPNPVGSKKKR
ncbi:MAG: hypothetical protein U0414_07400 [Polyangiaceae bacterium]